jgi:hypothetical protein
MTGEPRAGRYRIVQENNSVLFFLVYQSDEDGALVICDVKFTDELDEKTQKPLDQFIDKSTKRKLSSAMWSRLVSWC